jgi:Arc/MetJ-type ribon-helix-helix transcriptional regulator
MTITLDAATEARIQREIDRGAFRDPAQVIAHALDLLETEIPAAGDWLGQNREDIQGIVAEGDASHARGETYSPEESQAILERRRAERVRNAA